MMVWGGLSIPLAGYGDVKQGGGRNEGRMVEEGRSGARC